MKNIILLLFLIIFVSITIFQLTKIGWLDADTYGLFNQTCHHQYDIETPLLSKTIFHLLPCNETIWKLFGLFLNFCIFSAFYYGTKKFSLPNNYAFLIGLSGYLITFLLKPEDDTIAYPLVAALSFWLLSKMTIRKSIVYLLIGVFLSFFVWKGAIIPMGIIGLGSIFPLLSIIPFIYLGLNSFFTDNWGNSSEAIVGNGFILGSLILVPIIFVAKTFFRYQKELFILVSLILLCFFEPKWGSYVIIGTIPFYAILREKYSVYQEYLDLALFVFSIFCLIIFLVISLLSQVPTDSQWVVLREAKVLQDGGQVVHVDWGLGYYLEYIGGFADQKGGYHGKVAYAEPFFYYVGWERRFSGYFCSVVDERDDLLLVRCVK